MGEFLGNSLFFGVAVSLIGYEIGLLLRRKFALAILNPLLIAICCVILFNKALGIPYQEYYAGAQYLAYLLTPATVALAVPLYRQLALLKTHWLAILCGLGAGIVAGGVGILALSVLFGLDHQLYVTMLPKSVTTAIGMELSRELGGVVAITTAVIIVTGILGNVIGDFIFSLFHIKHPIAKGLALGNSAHAIGTAKAMELGEVEGAMSSLAIAVAGVLTVVSASVFAQFL